MKFTANISHLNAPTPSEPNYSIHSLDVPPDFPISISRSGEILSTYQDMSWDFTPYANRNLRLHFQFKTDNGNAIDEVNLFRFKKLILWTMYAWRQPLSSNTISGISAHIRTIIKLCVDNKIDIAKLSQFPNVFNQIIEIATNAKWVSLRRILKLIYTDRHILGFFVLTNDQISALDKHFEIHSVQHQTPYIPIRILNNIIDRCTLIVNGYLKNEKNFEQLYSACLEYRDRAFREFGPNIKSCSIVYKKGIRTGCVEYYSGKKFHDLTSEYGVHDIMMSTNPPNTILRLASMSSYLTNVGYAARMLIAAFTGMRDKEHVLLRRECHSVREDEMLGAVHFITGSTTKTIKDKSAYWVTSPSVEIAIKAAISISLLREKTAIKYCEYNPTRSNKSYLFPPSSEPWLGYAEASKNLFKDSAISVRFGGIDKMKGSCPHLLPFDLLKITKEDLEEAIRMTPDLNLKKYKIDEPWNLSWHQFRRSFVCNALSAGVTLPALCWQLKHAGPAMTLHYGKNYFSKPLDPELKKEFENAQIEISRIKVKELAGENFVAANGINKNSVLRTLNSYEGDSFKAAILNGSIAIKNTALGVCTNPLPCEFGGWDNVSECVTCAKGLIQKSNQGRMEKMLEIVESDLAECRENDSLLIQSLNAQKNAIVEALYAIKKS
ncbi:hypothetical protein ACO0LL_02355 [Undibacterium sp. TC4M20W]|uniref:hypothetical protein n=1 Tax=Undibacterium sp. TC4M20W TaxID=3413052 RepID=UPI003BF18F65